MCGRYGFSVKDAREVYTRFAVVNTLPDFHPRYNIAPGQLNPVVLAQSPNSIMYMFWGLIPSWAKDDRFKFKTINARSETAASAPVYRKPLQLQRCLVPATYFFEWDKSHKPSIPYVFRLKNEELFAFAGLFDRWHDPQTKEEIVSYTIMTTEANKVVGAVHPRMPVILKKEDEEVWLDPDITEPERLQPLLKPYPDTEMESVRVSPAVNSPRNDTEAVIQPV